MNYYNPYFYSIPSSIATPKVGILRRIFGGTSFSLGSFLSKTQKALGFVNQVIPVVNQVKPMVKNAKTMFKVMNEFKKTDNIQTNTNNTNENNNFNDQTITSKKESNLGPTFFI